MDQWALQLSQLLQPSAQLGMILILNYEAKN